MLLQVVFVAVAFQITYGYLTREEEQLANNGCYKDMCWKDINYPAENIMNKLISSDMGNLNTFGQFGQSDVTEDPKRSCDLCEHVVSLRVTPLATIEDDKKYFVVNTENYLQNITLNICKALEKQRGSRCKAKQEDLPNDLLSDCEQKYTTIRLLCYDMEEDTFVGKSVKYPSACVCTIKKNNE